MPLVRVGAVVEQEPDVLEALVVERVRERVRPARLRAVLEQDREALGALRLGRVVERLAVVGVRARLEQRACQLRVVADARGAVERRHPPYSLTKNAFGSAPRSSSSRPSAVVAKHEWHA